jgi:hypothetical protein
VPPWHTCNLATRALSCLVKTAHQGHGGSRDRKGDTHASARLRIDGGVYADDLAPHIEGGPARIALVDRRVDLNEIVAPKANPSDRPAFWRCIVIVRTIDDG